MSDKMTPHPVLNIENKLDQIYGQISPDPAFANQLERRLSVQAEALKAAKSRQRHGFPLQLAAWLKRPAWNYALALVILLALIVGIAGPAEVLARVQRLFAPGVGFVEPGVTRVLSAPVEVIQGDATLRVESAVAYPKYTQVSLTVGGLPREKFGPDQGPQSLDLLPYLLLPDATRLKQTGSITGMGDRLQATLDFPALPQDIEQATLVLPRLPSLPAGFAPENWSIPLHFRVVDGQAPSTRQAKPAAESYSPQTDPVSANGVTAQILQAGQTGEEAGLQIQYRWNNPEWKWMNNVLLSLTDQTGRKYEQHLDSVQPMTEADAQVTPGALTRTYRFEPFSSQARQATLTIDQINFTLASQAHFTFDPGQSARPGQTWDLSSQPGSQIDIASVPVQVLSARINPGQDAGKANQLAHYHMELLVQTKPQNGLSLQNLSVSLDPGRIISSSCEALPGDRLRITIDLLQVPDRPLNLYFPYGEVSVKGPWIFEWVLPSQ